MDDHGLVRELLDDDFTGGFVIRRFERLTSAEVTVHHRIRLDWTIDRALSAGSAIPRPLRLAHGLDSFFHAQQRGGLERLDSASCRDGH